MAGVNRMVDWAAPDLGGHTKLTYILVQGGCGPRQMDQGLVAGCPATRTGTGDRLACQANS